MIIQFRTFDGTVLKSINAVSADGPIEYGTTVPKSVRRAILSLLSKANYSEDVTDYLNTVSAWASDANSVSYEDGEITINGTSPVELVASTTPSNEPVSWESSDENIISITSKGLATGIANGTCKLIARSGDKIVSINAKAINIT